MRDGKFDLGSPSADFLAAAVALLAHKQTPTWAKQKQIEQQIRCARQELLGISIHRASSPYRSTTRDLRMLMSSLGLRNLNRQLPLAIVQSETAHRSSPSTATAPSRSTTFIPESTRPKILCLDGGQGVEMKEGKGRTCDACPGGESGQE